MADNYQGEGIPVFLINGFLESGKTSFIQYTMNQDYFKTEGNTLLLLCEEGEKEYDPIELAKLNTTPIYMKEITEFQADKLQKLADQYKPERILIEWNGMWNQDDLYGGPMSEAVLAGQQNREPKYSVSMPKDWFLYQVITIVDGSTLKMYLSNMRSFLGQMLRNAELCIVNRCDNLSNEDMVEYRRKLRAMGQNAMIMLEDKDGEIPQSALPEELPYDISQDKIAISDNDYGTWFLDCMDNPERYLGKELSFTAMVLKRKNMPEDEFIPGRMAMTCCAQDMSFLGFICKGDKKLLSAFSTRDWIRVKAKVSLEEREEYHGVGPVLQLVDIARTGEISEPVSF